MWIRTWLSRLAAATLIPLGFLLLVEVFLRMVGIGFPASYFVPSSTQEQVSISNPYFGWRFFPPALARAPLPVEIGDQETFRVFVVGGSAALGTPEPAFGFARILEVLLEQAHPETDIQVVSATMAAINSHVVREVVRDISLEKPDLLVVYLGNNEVVGPYGAGTVFGDFSPSLGLLRSAIAVKSTRLGQTMQRLIAGSPTGDWRGMQMFLDHQVRFDDPRLETVYSHLSENLSDIVDFARDGGAEVIVGTVAVNLRDQPPFASETPEGAEKKRYDELLSKSLEKRASGQAETALADLDEALSFADRSAELHFERGHALLALNRIEEAQTALQLARDLDTLRFRADSRINDTIREVATREKVTLVDLDRNLSSRLPGHRLFHEHVHFNFAGNYEVAAQLSEAVSGVMVQRGHAVKGGIPSIQDVAEQLPLSRFDLAAMEESILAMVAEPPFQGRRDLTEHLIARRRRLAQLEASFDEASWRQTLSRYDERISSHPDDLLARVRRADLLGRFGNPAEARSAWRDLTARIPEIPDWQSNFALATSAAGAASEAATILEEAIDRWPQLAPSFLLNLGIVHERASAAEAAESAYRRALEIRPDFRLALANLAALSAKSGDLDTAVEEWRDLVERHPQFTEAHHDLGVALESRGDLEGAAESFRLEIASRPHGSQGHLSLGIVLEKLGRPEEALDSYRKALEIDPLHAQPHLMIADLLLSHGAAEKALPFYRRGLELDPGNTQAQENLRLAEAARESGS